MSRITDVGLDVNPIQTNGFTIGGGYTNPKVLTQQVNTWFTGADTIFTGTASAVLTLPGTDTLCGLNSTQTLLNKTIGAGTTSTPALNFSTGVAPTSPSTGNLWFDGTNLILQDNAGTKHVNKRKLPILYCSGYTPAATGADIVEIPMPYHSDGTTSVNWNVRRITFNVGTSGGAPSINMEYYLGSGAFSATTVGTVTLANNAFQGSQASGFNTSQISSGSRVRFNVTSLATALYWTVLVEYEEA